MLTPLDITEIVSKLSYRDWNFRVLEKGDGFLLQIQFMAPDSESPNGEPKLQSCRKWYVSQYATKNEVIRTAWKAVMAAVEHEAAEAFLYRGKAVFNPHVDFDAVVDAQLPSDLRA